ncbi:pimeloyl-ACP methyl ester carboxylesterase [Streptomyces achromogenes]|uniref:Pimeloyl-ACP methyl ester carboxylesterase n=1 Tax=Streptomyces achromogenes TaxID=67255 RepID=A0ABU0PT07_STRAH|nr:pimeloyl-ACP methyl ester carboxylesterase [Streptomyces achromogenes]
MGDKGTGTRGAGAKGTVVAPGAALAVRRRPTAPAGAAVLMLHGGREHSRTTSKAWHPAALRMRPVLRAAVASTDRRDVLFGEVRYRFQGWNATADPVDDAARALDELRRLAGEVPVILVGHSMGGRAALRAAADPAVHGVLALAPWCPPGEPVDHLAGTRIVVLHGDRDRVTDPGASAEYVRRARQADAQAGLVLVRGGDHAMLRRGADWHRATTAVVAQLLRARSAPGSLEGLAGRACAAENPLPW